MTDTTSANDKKYELFSKVLLGETSREIQLTTQNDIKNAALELATQSRRCIKIFSHDLEEAIYNHEAFVKAVAKVTQLHRSTYVQILVRDPKPAVKCGHSLVEEAQRLSSHIHIRRISRDFRDNTESFLIADDVGLLFRKHWERYAGVVNFHGVTETLKKLSLFTKAWELGEPETDFRRLSL